jgi:hypothetical protein
VRTRLSFALKSLAKLASLAQQLSLHNVVLSRASIRQEGQGHLTEPQLLGTSSFIIKKVSVESLFLADYSHHYLHFKKKIMT